MTFEQLEHLIVAWAEERNILDQSDPFAQLAVTLEECSELLKALNEVEHAEDIENLSDVSDAYGDILVTLIIGAAMSFPSMSIVEHLEGAYHTIKDRKGKMVNGKFVKEFE